MSMRDSSFPPALLFPQQTIPFSPIPVSFSKLCPQQAFSRGAKPVEEMKTEKKKNTTPVNISRNNLSEDSFGTWWLFRLLFCLPSLFADAAQGTVEDRKRVLSNRRQRTMTLLVFVQSR